ncbi:Glucooligosaccharide oxidase [Rhizophagus diaphanus]|nr:Glucooligosaccharide oxidase [Rhizophagus diaphanus] [Rhizophagus sp. MUCL 43196]
MKLIRQLDTVPLLLWCILSFNFIEIINSLSLLECLNSIEGPVIYPNDKDFKPLIIDQNIRVNYTPSVLVYALNNKDVQNAVNCSILSHMNITARSGGHSYEKYGLGGRDNDIVLDLTFIDSITIDSEAQTARIGAGNRLGNVYNKLNQAGFLIPAGSCPSVGIGGHALGGGFGYLGRKYGYACDNIISMQMVDAEGNLLHIDSFSNPDLFFALRGAGIGSYGIVTYFVFRIHPTPSLVTSMELVFNRTNMTQVYQLFRAYDQVGPSLDNDIAFKMRLRNDSLSIIGLYLGSSKNATKAMEKFLSEAPEQIKPIVLNETTFLNSIALLYDVNKYEVVNPRHVPNFFKAKSFFVNKGEGIKFLAIKYLVTFLNKINRGPCKTFASFDLHGGVSEIHQNNSFIHRNAAYCIQIETGWNSKEEGDKCVKELNDFGRKFQYFTSKFSYQGFIDRDLDNWQTRYYGDDVFKKLVEIKAEYDPKNLFNFDQSIPVKL